MTGFLMKNYFVFGIVLVILLFIYYKLAEKNKKKSNISMPFYKLIYTDNKKEKRLGVEYGKILYSEKYDIQGKPDYIFKKSLGKSIVPVEVKSGSIGGAQEPHYGDLMQLAAYFVILKEIYGIKPKFGKIIYKDYMFKIRNTYRIRKELHKTLITMRSMLKGKRVPADPKFIKCRYCVCNGTVCEFCKTGRN